MAFDDPPFGLPSRGPPDHVLVETPHTGRPVQQTQGRCLRPRDVPDHQLPGITEIVSQTLSTQERLSHGCPHHQAAEVLMTLAVEGPAAGDQRKLPHPGASVHLADIPAGAVSYTHLR